MHSLVKTFEHNGKSLTLKQWAKELNVPYHTLHSRFHRGYSIERLLSKEFLEIGRPRKKEEPYL